MGSFGALLLLAACGLGALALAQPAIAALGCPGCYGFERLAGRLYVDPAMPAETRAVLRRAAAEAPDRLARCYGSPVCAPVVLACSDEACQRRIDGGGALGVAYGSHRLRLSPRGLDGVVLLHELSHIELHARLGSVRAALGGGVPAWFDEGVAVVVSGDARYLVPEGTSGSRCRAEPGGGLPAGGREWRHSGAVDHALYARAACRVLRWMDANGGPPAGAAWSRHWREAGAFRIFTGGRNRASSPQAAVPGQAAGSGWVAAVWSASSSAARASTGAGKPASAATFSSCDRPA